MALWNSSNNSSSSTASATRRTSSSTRNISNSDHQNDSDLEAYAQRALEDAAATYALDSSVEVPVDDNLGAYVVNSLKESGLSNAQELKGTQLFESLSELLQDQCHMEQQETAADLLQEIAINVFTPRLLLLQHQHDRQQQPMISPLAAQSLLPGALLEEEEDEEDEQQQQQQHQDEEAPNTDDETAFPPLGSNPTPTETTTTSHHYHNHHHTTKHHKSHTNSSHHARNNSNDEEASELAAALFVRPTTRSRQSSMDETSSSYERHNSISSSIAAASISPNLQPTPIPEQEYPMLQYTAEVLLHMNAELSPEAAYCAAHLASSDINVAQYILEQVASELPVCRHLLQDGRCYRADCSFSHDIESHTCVFWLKSRCTKNTACRFLHGIAPRWLDQVPDELPQYYDYDAAQQLYEEEQQQYDAYGHSYSSSNNNNGTMIDYTNLQQQQYPQIVSSSYNSASASSWIPSPPTSGSFANIALTGYNDRESFTNTTTNTDTAASTGYASSSSALYNSIPTVKIPQDLWNPHENRDATAFYIADPLERYYAVTNAITVPRNDVIDLHFQSLQTFGTVLDAVLPEKLQSLAQVWIVTGTGHHVGSRTHQKGGGALEGAVLEYLVEHYGGGSSEYSVQRGRDRNGQGGAVLVERRVVTR